MDDPGFMCEALRLAQTASDMGEIPVGCVVVDGDGNIIGRGRNRREEERSASAHAEIEAITQACKYKNDWRLSDCSLYVTLEPCPMCAGAIINSRIKKLFYGAKEPNSGSCGSVINLFMERYDHSPEIVGGLLEDECAQLLRDFFKKIR